MRPVSSPSTVQTTVQLAAPLRPQTHPMVGLLSLRTLLPVVALLALGGCTKNIPNTSVPDNADNREVIAFMEDYRHSLEDRDVSALLEMASPRYLDMSGTPNGADDVDFDTLSETLGALFERVQDVRFEIRYRNVVFREDDVLVEFRYTASWLIADHRGENQWRHKVEDKRMVLEWDSENARYRILSGM